MLSTREEQRKLTQEQDKKKKKLLKFVVRLEYAKALERSKVEAWKKKITIEKQMQVVRQ